MFVSLNGFFWEWDGYDCALFLAWSTGNTFSCLAGLKFNWRLVKESDAIQAVRWTRSLSEERGRETRKRHQHKACLVFCDYRRFVRHHDAGYAPPPHILSLESAGQWGESVLLYGIHSGSALIKVYFQHPEFEVWKCIQHQAELLNIQILAEANNYFFIRYGW